MMTNSRLIIYLLFVTVAILFTCKEVTKEEQPPAPAVSKPTISYPALGNQEISQLYSVADKVDMIFYELPISVNQDDAASAKNSVLYVSPSPVDINSSCRPLGRLSWISQGAIYKEADIYMDSVCQYFIFMTNNKPVAANAMSESGVQFFTNIIKQVEARQ